MILWDTAAVDRLVTYRQQGLSMAQIGRRLGVSRNAVCGAVRRYMHGKWDERSREQRMTGKTVVRVLKSQRWTEAYLTEPWVAYHARKQTERAALVGDADAR